MNSDIVCSRSQLNWRSQCTIIRLHSSQTRYSTGLLTLDHIETALKQRYPALSTIVGLPMFGVMQLLLWLGDWGDCFHRLNRVELIIALLSKVFVEFKQQHCQQQTWYCFLPEICMCKSHNMTYTKRRSDIIFGNLIPRWSTQILSVSIDVDWMEDSDVPAEVKQPKATSAEEKRCPLILTPKS